jgi:hypothetical protein
MPNNDENVFEGHHHQELSRREFLTLSAALASAGVFYDFIDHLAHKPDPVAFAAAQPLPQEQYLSTFPSVELLSSGDRLLRRLKWSGKNSFSLVFALMYSNRNSSLLAKEQG